MLLLLLILLLLLPFRFTLPLLFCRLINCWRFWSCWFWCSTSEAYDEEASWIWCCLSILSESGESCVSDGVLLFRISDWRLFNSMPFESDVNSFIWLAPIMFRLSSFTASRLLLASVEPLLNCCWNFSSDGSFCNFFKIKLQIKITRPNNQTKKNRIKKAHYLPKRIFHSAACHYL